MLKQAIRMTSCHLGLCSKASQSKPRPPDCQCDTLRVPWISRSTAGGSVELIVLRTGLWAHRGCRLHAGAEGVGAGAAGELLASESLRWMLKSCEIQVFQSISKPFERQRQAKTSLRTTGFQEDGASN